MKMTSSSPSHFHLRDLHHYIADKTMHGDENEDFGVMNFHGKVIDLNNLARNGDSLFENELNKLSEGLVTQNELLQFVSDLKGRSENKTDSGMYVDASKFGDFLPDGWKILLSLRPGVSRPSLYCKEFVSPLKVPFNSCKDVALSLKSQHETNGANPPHEGAMTLVEGDRPVEFDLLHTNPLHNVAAEDEVTYGNPCRDMVVADNHQKVQRKRKRKTLKKSDFQGLGVISINGKKIDLLHLARDASDEFQAELNRMTRGMIREAEFMGVLRGLEGEWSSAKMRRKFVEATILGDAFPKNWRILLGLRPRLYPFTLQCRKFVSPLGKEFGSCKEAALYIKSLYDANRLEEGDSHVDNQHNVPMRKRTRISKAVENSDEEYKGLGVIEVNGETRDLTYLALAGDSVFADKLKKITKGMKGEDELLRFLASVNGRWVSILERRINVYAATIKNLLPVNWQILIQLGPHAHQPSLHCWKFVSPTGQEFDSCKDVAFFLKTQSEEEATMLREKGCQVDAESVARVPRSNSLGTHDASHVPIHCLIQCNYCTSSFESIGVLEFHLQRDHKPIIQSLYTETLSQKHAVPCGTVIVQEMNSSKQRSAAINKTNARCVDDIAFAT